MRIIVRGLALAMILASAPASGEPERCACAFELDPASCTRACAGPTLPEAERQELFKQLRNKFQRLCEGKEQPVTEDAQRLLEWCSAN
jgi:hypothetical protein